MQNLYAFLIEANILEANQPAVIFVKGELHKILFSLILLDTAPSHNNLWRKITLPFTLSFILLRVPKGFSWLQKTVVDINKDLKRTTPSK